MLVDPVFTLDSTRDDVSNVRDASDLHGLWECQRDGDDDSGFIASVLGSSESDAIDAEDESGLVTAVTPPKAASDDGFTDSAQHRSGTDPARGGGDGVRQALGQTRTHRTC